MRGTVFFWGVGGFCLGVSLRTLFVLPVMVLVPCMIVFGFFLGWWLIERHAYQLAIAVCVFCAIAGGVRTSFARTELPHEWAQSVGTTMSLTGIVVAPPDAREKNLRLTVEVKKENVSTRVLVAVRQSSSVLIGEDVQVRGKLQKPEPFATDGGRTFAYDKFLAKDGVFLTMPYATLTVLSPPHYEFWIWDALLAVSGALQTALRHSMAAPYSALGIGLLLGGKQGLGDDLLKIFTTAGLLQIVVLSGYNVTIVADAILRAFKRAPKGVGFIAAAIGIIAFVAAAGAGSSAVRASIMAIFSLLARATNRTYDVSRALCISLVLILLYNPLLLIYDPGLQLSFLATLGLVVGSPVLESKMLWMKFVTFRGLLATTFGAQIAVLPLLLYQSGSLSWVAIPANIIVSPLVPIAMAASACASIGGFLMPAFAPYIGVPAYVSLWWIVVIAKTAASLPFAAVIIPAFPFWIIVGVYLSFGIAYIYHKEKSPRLSDSRAIYYRRTKNFLNSSFNRS